MTKSVRFMPGVFFVRDHVWRLLTSLFLLGVTVGAIVGAFAKSELIDPTPAMFLEHLDSSSGYSESFFLNLFFLLLLFVSSTSYLGIFLVSAIVAVKGCFLSRLLALFYVLYGLNGQCFALLTVAIPAALFLPGFILCAVCAYRASLRLLSLRFRAVSYTVENGFVGKSFIVALLCVLTFVLYKCFLLPLIMAKLF